MESMGLYVRLTHNISIIAPDARDKVVNGKHVGTDTLPAACN